MPNEAMSHPVNPTKQYSTFKHVYKASVNYKGMLDTYEILRLMRPLKQTDKALTSPKTTKASTNFF